MTIASSGSKCCSVRCCVLSSSLCIIMLIYALLSVTLQLMPEMDMYITSTCKDRSRVWNGKGAGILSEILNLGGFAGGAVTQRLLRSESRGLLDYRHEQPLQNQQNENGEKPIILIGTHHKTGTYLAKKMFSTICARLQLCCIFHVTNDDEATLKETVNFGDPDMVAHWHWAWFPEEIAPNYRFIHFYRDPLAKIASGYRYHMDGVEAWSRNFERYARSCSSNPAEVCDGVHLCEPCCNWVFSKLNASNGATPKVSHPTTQEFQHGREFVCKHLGPVADNGLADSLTNWPVEQGVLAEAGLDYYESLTMALIANHTWHDPRSLNIDLDLFMQDFEGHTRAILKFLKLPHGASVVQSLTHDLMFFDINESPVYRAFMENPLYNHVNTNSNPQGQNASDIVRSNPELLEAYRPLLHLMTGAYERAKRFRERKG